MTLLLAALTAFASSADFDVVTEANTQSVSAHLAASWDYEGQMDYERALDAALSARTQLRAPSYEVNYRLGWLHFLNGNLEESVRSYQKAILMKPASIEARNAITQPLIAMGRNAQAQAVCEDILEAAPTDFTARHRLAWLLSEQGEYAAAAEHYGVLAELYPSEIDIRARLGEALAKSGDTARARFTFEQVLRDYANHPVALEGLAAL